MLGRGAWLAGVAQLGVARTPTRPGPVETSTRPARTTREENPPSTPRLRGCGGLLFLWVLPYMGRGRVGELGVCFLMSLLLSLHQPSETLWLAGFGLPPLSPPSLGEGTMLCGLRAWLFTRD